MRKSILALTVLILAAGVIFTSCETPGQKVEDAKDDVTQAEEDLEQAKLEYTADMDAYRQQTAERIAENDRILSEFDARISTEKEELRADYRAQMAELEKSNSDMKMKMDGYTSQNREDWEAFKAEFNRDMEALGASLKNLTVKNN